MNQPFALSALALAATTLLSGCLGSDDDEAPVAAAAAPTTYTLGGSVSGLSANGLVVTNGTDVLTILPGSTTFQMPQRVAGGAAYMLAVQVQPAGQTCTIANGGTSTTQADVANVVITCSINAHALGGTLAGLSSSGLVLANGSDTLTPAPGATSFQLNQPVAQGSSYALTVRTQPSGQTCGIVGGSGTMADRDVADIAVTCSAQPYQLGGSITGLGAGGLVLANGSDLYAVAPGAGSFTMAAAVAYGSAYAVTIQAQPTGLTCSVANGGGTMAAADVANVAVTCSANRHNVSGTVAGLLVPGLVLAGGSDTIAVASGASSFVVPTPFAEGAAYAVTVQTQPSNTMCSVGNGSGTMGTGDVSNVVVSCAPSAFTLGGSITGLDFSGLVLANGSDALSVAANATVFTMPTPVATGATYSVSVQSQPTYKSCTITSGSGLMPAAVVGGVMVSCVSIAQVSTLAGTAGVRGSADGTGAAASFSLPFGVAINSSGDIFVGDLDNNLIRKVTPSGVVTTFAGSTTRGSADGTGSAARFYQPAGVAFDAQDNLYVADRLNYLVRKITPAGVVTTLAGTAGSPGSANGIGTAASFSAIYGLAVDSAGNIFVADRSNNQIRKITPAGIVTTFAGSSSVGSADGSGSAASFSGPSGLAVDRDDNVYVSETGGNRIRKITPAGVVTTIAGNGTAGNVDGTGPAATFNSPYGLAVAADGTIYVADTLGNKIRRVTQAGVVTTIAGPVGLTTSGSADGPGSSARLNVPTTLAIDASANLIVVDYNNFTLRKIIP